MKLGEILVAKGVLKPEQLELALRSQLIFGGHLGTTLIEMGLLDEDALGEVLATSAGVPYAHRELLANIAPETIKTIPAKIAEEYQVVPFKLEDKSVHLAFVDPRDIRALDALKFAIGRSIVPWIAPEVRIFLALEKYYRVGRRARYIKLDTRLDETADESQALNEAGPLPPADDTDLFASGDDSEFGYGKSWQQVADELALTDSPEGGRATTAMSLPALAEGYCLAESRDDLARTVLDFAKGRAERMLLMFVRANHASVWEERGFSLPHAAIDVTFEVTSEPLFHLLMGSDHYRGALPRDPAISSFYARLGAMAPAELLLIPVHVNDQLVAVALADGGPHGSIPGPTDEFLKAFRLFQTAVMMVALRKNLRDAARPVVRAGV